MVLLALVVLVRQIPLLVHLLHMQVVVEVRYTHQALLVLVEEVAVVMAMQLRQQQGLQTQVEGEVDEEVMLLELAHQAAQAS